MKTSTTFLLSVLSSLSFVSLGCSSDVGLADQRPHENVGGAGGGSAEGGASSGGSADQNTAGAAANGGDPGSGGAPAAQDAGLLGPPADPSFCASSCKTFDLRATGPAPVVGDSLPPGDEATTCYGFHLNESTDTHGTAIAPLLDNDVVVHDFQFYKVTDSQVGASPTTCASAPDGTLLFDWEPGTVATPESFELPPGDFVLRVHRVNTTDRDQRDSSGVRICACAP